MPTYIPTSSQEYQENVTVLLDLANDPRDVQATSDYWLPAVIIPDYLYERWQQYNAVSESSPPSNGTKKRGTS